MRSTQAFSASTVGSGSGSLPHSHKKRNSLCLDSSGAELYSVGDRVRYPPGCFRKARRSTETHATPHSNQLFNPQDATYDFQGYMPQANNPPRSGGRRSSLITPKQSWPGTGQNLAEPLSSFNPPSAYGQDIHVANYDIPRINGYPLAQSAFRNLQRPQESKEDLNYFAVRSRALSNEGGLVKKGAWTQEEDDLLRSFAEEAKTNNWTEIAEKIPGRSAKQCRERWCFNLDPSINKEAWTPKEDLLLIQKQKEIGNKWAQIAQLLPGRTENAVKTRYKSIVRAQKREWHPSEDLKLLELHLKLGANWESIAAQMAEHRTKHAVKMRFKDLQTGLNHGSLPEFGSARQTVREAYYPQATINQVSEHYQNLAAGQIPFNSMKTFPSLASLLSLPRGFSFKQEPRFEVNRPQGLDPLDDFFNLYSEDEPLILA